MSQSVPVGDFKELTPGSQAIDEVLNTDGDSPYGYFVECDLEYPNEIKEKTKHFPFCPEKKKVSDDMFSSYMKKWSHKVINLQKNLFAIKQTKQKI